MKWLCLTFFAERKDLPSDAGFALFGPEHRIWIAACLLFIVAGALLFRKGFQKMRKGVLLFAALSSFFWQVAQGLYRIVLGYYGIGTLPLHICCLASYLVILHYFYHPAALSEILYFPMLFGPWFAIFFPDWTAYPAWSFMSCASFCVHASILLYIILQMENGIICPSLRRIYAPAIFLAVYAAVMIPFDHHFEVNYGFLNVPSPGSPLITIAQIFGYGIGYYAGYAILVSAVMLAAYLPIELRKSRKWTHKGRC